MIKTLKERLPIFSKYNTTLVYNLNKKLNEKFHYVKTMNLIIKHTTTSVYFK